MGKKVGLLLINHTSHLYSYTGGNRARHNSRAVKNEAAALRATDIPDTIAVLDSLAEVMYRYRDKK